MSNKNRANRDASSGLALLNKTLKRKKDKQAYVLQ